MMMVMMMMMMMMMMMTTMKMMMMMVMMIMMMMMMITMMIMMMLKMMWVDCCVCFQSIEERMLKSKKPSTKWMHMGLMDSVKELLKKDSHYVCHGRPPPPPPPATLNIEPWTTYLYPH